MNWWGKILGAFLGFGVANIFGAIIGIWIGHQFDKGLSADFSSMNAADQEKIQASFFATTFQLLGHVAKADGRVTESEIAAAEGVMSHLGLNADLRKSAIEHFNQGKQANFDWRKPLSEFAELARRQRNLKQMFIEIQIQVAFADGSIEAKEQNLIFEFARVLGFSKLLIQQLIVMI
ncbi:MAG: co-chaperone DjlA, partial [Gammaproteobacteria bacterium]|nr:co-chaperone DjlA [Gammaproteobacteria bacterium]